MKRETAVAVLAHVETAGRALNRIMDTLHEQTPPEEFQLHVRPMAELLADRLEVSRPIWTEHPDLDVNGILPKGRKH